MTSIGTIWSKIVKGIVEQIFVMYEINKKGFI